MLAGVNKVVNKVVLSPIVKAPIEKVAQTGTTEKIVNYASKINPATGKTNCESVLKKYTPAVAGLWLEMCYAAASLCSDKIPDERKRPLIINLLFTGLSSAIGSIALAPFIEKCQDALGKRLGQALKNQGINTVTKAERCALKEGLRAMPHIAVAAILLHYVCPVVATPVADKINKFLWKKHKKDD